VPPPLTTIAPDTPAPPLTCPMCDHALAYVKTIIGGVRPTERWDFYQCGRCHAVFEYRHRTRRLRIASGA
jgi:hypothetical protein